MQRADKTPRPVNEPTAERAAPAGAHAQAVHDSPRLVAQRLLMRHLFGDAADGAGDATSMASPHHSLGTTAQGRVAQRLMTVAAFKALTPWKFGRLRWSITAVDDALAAVWDAAPHAQVDPLENLVDVATQYILAKQDSGDDANDRIPHVHTLIAEAGAELVQAVKRTKVHKMHNAPNGAAAAVLADFTVPPLGSLPLPALDAILAVGHIVSAADLAALLTAATSAVGAGSAAQRLISVLRATPAPHTPLALAPVIAARMDIDHKILRGRLPNPLGPVGAPIAGHRDVIGGHGPRVLNTPRTFALAANAPNPNGTSAANFRLVARGDAAGTAAAVAGGVAGNVIAAFQAEIILSSVWLNAPPAFNAGFANAPIAVQNASNLQRANALAVGVPAIAQFNGHVLAAQAAANAIVVAGDTQHATLLATFIDAVEGARASATAITTSATALLATPGLAGVNAGDRQAIVQERQNIAAAFLAFETAGPILTNPKNSTLTPAGMSEDAILALTDVVAAIPATLFRHHPSANAPPNGALVSTKHQHLHQGILWIAMKDNVTYNNLPAITLTGGSVTSFYPTQHTAIPPDPAHPAADIDGFTGVH